MIFRAVLALGALLTLTLGAPPALAQVDAYEQTLRLLADRIERARSLEGAARAGEVRRAIEDIRGVEPVETPAGTVRPELGHVEAALSESPPDLEQAAGYVEELLAGVTSERAQAPDPAQERALQEALDDPRFDPDPPKGWLQRALEAIGDWFRRLFSRLPAGGGSGALGLAQWLLVAACVTLLGGALFLILRALRDRAGDRKPPAGAGERAAPLTAASMLAAAAAHARSGDYRSAVRANFISLLLFLHERGRLRYDHSLTNREHLARIGQGTPLASSLEPVVWTFDDVWYGNVPIDAAGYEAYSRRADMLRAAAT